MDLVRKMAPFLDSHLLLECVLPETLNEEGRRLKLSILQNTYRFQEATAFAKSMGISGALLQGFEQHIKTQEQNIAHHQSKAENILKVLDNEELCAQLRSEGLFNASYLGENFKIKPEDLKSLQTYAKDLYECGKYERAEKLLHNVRALSQDGESNTSALWGKLACLIILKRRDQALECLLKLKDRLDHKAHGKTSTAQIEKANQQAWIIHWAVLFMFDTSNGRTNPLHEKLQTLLLEPTYLNTLQMVAPHLLKYFVAVLALNGDLAMLSEKVVLPILQNNEVEENPLFRVVSLIFDDLDFEQAFAVLHDELPKACMADPILKGISGVLKESLEREVVLVYCKVYNSVSLTEMASMARKGGKEETEIWLMNILQSHVVRASVEGESIELERESNDIFAQIYELAREDTFKVNVLIEAFRKAKQYKLAALKHK